MKEDIAMWNMTSSYEAGRPNAKQDVQILNRAP